MSAMPILKAIKKIYFKGTVSEIHPSSRAQSSDFSVNPDNYLISKTFGNLPNCPGLWPLRGNVVYL